MKAELEELKAAEAARKKREDAAGGTCWTRRSPTSCDFLLFSLFVFHLFIASKNEISAVSEHIVPVKCDPSFDAER